VDTRKISTRSICKSTNSIALWRHRAARQQLRASANAHSLIGSHAGHEQIRRVKHQCLSISHFAVRWQAILSRPGLIALSRADFLPTANDEARHCIQDVRMPLGTVPRAIESRLDDLSKSFCERNFALTYSLS
jgi:hypothetical protein